jgi:hypothetical protein
MTQDTRDAIREQFADVTFILSNSRADYYTVGAEKTVTVSARHSSGKYLCHTCCVNECRHTKRIEVYERVFGTPETRQHSERGTIEDDFQLPEGFQL